MIPQIVLDNFQAWAVQVLVIGTIGAGLPALFRIRHPRSQLIYCHAVLVICLALPMLQPWKHRVILAGASPAAAIPSTAANSQVQAAGTQSPIPAIPWDHVLIWTFAIGFLARLSWTGMGLLRLHRHRLAATPMYPIPDAVRDATERIGVSAAFCVSSNGLGPVTFGFVRPVILLPESFFSMSQAAQCGVVCHELLHVRRRDWLIALAEEVAGAFLWFHPAVWWLLGQTRLSREQLVDAEVVSAISDPEPYINALLTIAGDQGGLDLAPAPLFLRRRHLLQRMHSLLTEVSMSRLRLISSYGVMIVLLASAGWLGVTLFPLTGLAKVREAAPSARVQPPPQDSPGYVVNVPPRSYPREAIQKGIEGTVAVELTFNVNGDIVDSRVLSGPEELRKTALESALNGKYSINVARTLQVLVNFKLPAPAPALPAGVVPPPVVPPAPGTGSMNVTFDSFDIKGLSEPQLSDLSKRLGQLIGKTMGSVDVQQAIRESGAGFPYSITTIPAGNARVSLKLSFGSEVRPIQTVPSPFGPAAAGATPSPFDGAPFVNDLKPTTSVDPEYPPLALEARIQGVVLLQVLIGQDGKVTDLRVVTGHPLFIQAAIQAVKQWVYPPQATAVATSATVNFKFPR